MTILRSGFSGIRLDDGIRKPFASSILGSVGASISVSIDGLTVGFAQHNVELTAMPSEGSPSAYEWQEDTVAISGATASTFTPVIVTNVSDQGSLRCKVTIGGEDYFSPAYEIRYAAGTAPAIADGQNWTVDDTSVNLDGSASGTGLTFSYGATGLPAGVSIHASTGAITGTPTAVDSGTVTITATDQYGRTLQDTFTFASALRAQATAADALGPYSWTVDDDTVNVDATGDFTANGNTLSYVITGLPTGLVDDTDGSFSGTPTVNGQSGTITITATDEYARETTSTPDYSTAWRAVATAADALGPYSFPEDSAISAVNLAADFTANGNTLTYAITGTALPASLSVSSAGSMTGTPDDVTASASYTVRATDEYSRQTDSTFSLEVTAVDSQAPTLSNDSIADATDTVTFDTDEGGTLIWATSLTTESPAADGSGGWTGTTLEDGTDTVASSGTTNFQAPYTATTGATGNSRKLSYYIRDAAGNDSNVITATFTVDVTAPTLSNLSVTPGDQQASLDWDTDEGNGTAFWALTTSATPPSQSDIENGIGVVDNGSAVISGTGAQTTIVVTSISNGVAYYFHIFHRDAHGNASTTSTSASVTPTAVGSWANSDVFDQGSSTTTFNHIIDQGSATSTYNDIFEQGAST